MYSLFLFLLNILLCLVLLSAYSSVLLEIIIVIVLVFLLILEYKKTDLKLDQVSFAIPKAILLFSFWSCIALLHYDYLESLTCISCVISYLKSNYQSPLTSDFFKNVIIVWNTYPRFITMFTIMIVWSFLFFLLTKKELRKNV